MHSSFLSFLEQIFILTSVLEEILISSSVVLRSKGVIPGKSSFFNVSIMLLSSSSLSSYSMERGKANKCASVYSCGVTQLVSSPAKGMLGKVVGFRAQSPFRYQNGDSNLALITNKVNKCFKAIAHQCESWRVSIKIIKSSLFRISLDILFSFIGFFLPIPRFPDKLRNKDTFEF